MPEGIVYKIYNSPHLVKGLREDFVNGKIEFEIDGVEHELLLEDFDRIEKFAYEKRLINRS
jgi:hypothetical protein